MESNERVADMSRQTAAQHTECDLEILINAVDDPEKEHL